MNRIYKQEAYLVYSKDVCLDVIGKVCVVMIGVLVGLQLPNKCLCQHFSC